MRSGILRTRVASLRLNRWAPWPSQIKRRQGYTMRALRSVARKLRPKNDNTMIKLSDSGDLKSLGASHAGSSPAPGTTNKSVT